VNFSLLLYNYKPVPVKKGGDIVLVKKRGRKLKKSLSFYMFKLSKIIFNLKFEKKLKFKTRRLRKTNRLLVGKYFEKKLLKEDKNIKIQFFFEYFKFYKSSGYFCFKRKQYKSFFWWDS